MGKFINNKCESKEYFFSFNYYYNYDEDFDNYSISTKALKYFVRALYLVPEDSPIVEEIEKEINKIYKSKLKN